MTFQDAENELKDLAKDRAWSLTYERASFFLPGGTAITAYIAGVGHGESSITYEGAIENMRKKLSLPPAGKPDPAPEAG